MGKKRASDDVDFVDLEREPKRTRKKPLELWEPPDFEPLPTAADAPNHGSPTPEILAVQDPYNLFKLFFTRGLNLEGGVPITDAEGALKRWEQIHR